MTLRHQETPPRWTRPAALRELAPQWGAATVGYLADPAPLVATPVLGGGDALDASALAFLVVLAQKDEEKRVLEEEGRREKRRRMSETEVRV